MDIRKLEKWEVLVKSRMNPAYLQSIASPADRDFAHSLEEALIQLMGQAAEDNAMISMQLENVLVH